MQMKDNHGSSKEPQEFADVEEITTQVAPKPSLDEMIADATRRTPATGSSSSGGPEVPVKTHSKVCH